MEAQINERGRIRTVMLVLKINDALIKSAYISGEKSILNCEHNSVLSKRTRRVIDAPIHQRFFYR